MQEDLSELASVMFFSQDLSIGPQSHWLLTFYIISASAILLLRLSRKPSLPSNAPKITSDRWPILGSLSFFTQRWDFYDKARSRSTTGNFSFYAGNYRVIALSGDEHRKIFFEHKGLACAEAYSTLLAGAPAIKKDNNAFGETNNGTSGFTSYFQKRLIRLLKGDQLKRGLPHILNDARTNLDALLHQPSSITDPFDSVYRMVFQVTMRTVACNEIADNPELLARCLKLFESIGGTGTPLSIMFPWLPTPSKVSRAYACAQLYKIFKGVIDEREKTDRRETDTLQFLIDQGDSIVDIITFVLGALFAGQVNSGINAAFILCYLAEKQEWLRQVLDEVNEVADRYCENKELSLADQLMKVPVEAWECDFPILDGCLKDTIRLQMSGNAFRLNWTGHDIPLGKDSTEVIPDGAYITLPTSDMHYNADIYPNPEDWDPARYFPDRAEDKKQTYAWMGWGLGRHPCLGVKFAKLENNVIIALFLAYFNDIRLCDKQGNSVEKVPLCNRNNYTPQRPSQEICLKLTLKE